MDVSGRPLRMVAQTTLNVPQQVRAGNAGKGGLVIYNIRWPDMYADHESYEDFR